MIQRIIDAAPRYGYEILFWTMLVKMKAAICALLFAAPVAFAAGTPCEKLTQLVLPNITVVGAAMTTSGPGATSLPLFCRIQAVAHPVPDSEIGFEIWIPSAATWNGKFQGVGNGGYSGALGYAAMARALQYAHVPRSIRELCGE